MTIMPKFSRWIRWKNRHALGGLNYPGVYALAVSTDDISGTKFNWNKAIKYFGVTTAGNGLKARLRQFDNTIKGKEGHGGGERFRYKYRKYDELTEKLFVSVYPVKCNINTDEPKPKDLLKMGEAVYLEYYCFAKYVRLFGELPEFNNKKTRKLKAKDLKQANRGV